MKLRVETTATVICTCFLTEEESEKVINYADENGLELTEAVAELYNNSEIDLYYNSTESDFSTESIDMVERERQKIMIKCPNCGSTAQIKRDLEITENKRRNSEKRISFYSCGCGCEFEIAQQYVNDEPIGEAEVWIDE